MTVEQGATFFADKNEGRIRRAAASLSARGKVRIIAVYDAPLGMNETPSPEPVYLMVFEGKPCPFCDCANPVFKT